MAQEGLNILPTLVEIKESESEAKVITQQFEGMSGKITIIKVGGGGPCTKYTSGLGDVIYYCKQP